MSRTDNKQAAMVVVVAVADSTRVAMVEASRVVTVEVVATSSKVRLSSC